jgi:hypothetical protein
MRIKVCLRLYLRGLKVHLTLKKSILKKNSCLVKKLKALFMILKA